MWSRRQVLALGGVAVAARTLRADTKPAATTTTTKAPDMTPILRTIPSTGETIPAIGLGSWQTFDVDDVAPITPVVEKFLALGGRVIDSSPMYGKAEDAIGKMMAALRKANPRTPVPFYATKVWTRGKADGITQMKRSLALLGIQKIDLMQIHNLVDWKAHLATLREWKAAGTVKYIGVTHYSHGSFDDLEQIIKDEKIDFVQLPYSVADRTAEKRLLPAARDAGVAVLVMQPFASGALFGKVKGKPLPAVATELGCTSWGQLFLKFLLADPVVTCPIPATSKVKHVEDNLGAMHGAVPDDKQRKAIVRALG